MELGAEQAVVPHVKSGYKKLNRYQRRVQKEIPHAQIGAVRCHSFLSENTKTGRAVGFSLLNCEPSPLCAEVCYAAQGPIAMQDARKKSVGVHLAINSDPIGTAIAMWAESHGQPLRLSSSGDMLATDPWRRWAAKLIELGVQLYGFTRRTDVYEMMESLGAPIMFSVDATTCTSKLQYAMERVPFERRACLTTPEYAPPIPCAVTFPVHGQETDRVSETEFRESDCMAVRTKGLTCHQCQRCFHFKRTW